MKRSLAFAVSVVSLSLPALMAGCSAAADPPDTAYEDEAGRTKAAIEIADQGPLALAGEAFSDVPLDASQRGEIEKLAQDAAARHVAVREARLRVAAELAAQIEKGAIDRSALEALFDDVEAEIAKVQPKDRAAVERVHSLLDADQRDALADGIETRIDDLKDQRGSGKEKMKEIAARLELTDAQKDSVRGIIRDRIMSVGVGGLRKGAKRGDQALDAFRGETFDLAELLPAEEMADGREKRRAMILDVIEEVLPELTAKQRKLAAALVREKAADLE